MKIICIGRNYREHASELNNPLPKAPLFFLKPDTAVLKNRQPFYIPDFSRDIHHEVEIVLKINRLGKNIQPEFAHKYYDEIAVGIDFTARDIQNECKKQGLPWEKAKAFDGSAPLGKFLHKNSIHDINNISFYLNINGKTVQSGNTKDMLFSFGEIISHVSEFFTLKMGDVIFTGTPAGVGSVKHGDILECYMEEQKLLEITVK